MAITYNAGTNTITVTGYTEATPCNFTDIYNADVAGGWGVVTRQCTDQFCFNSGLKIGDGSTSTWFADTNKQVLFTVAPISGVYGLSSFFVIANAHARLGTLTDASKKTTKDGCAIQFNVGAAGKETISGTSSSDIKLYSSYIATTNAGYLWKRNGTSGQIFHLYNSIVSGCDTLVTDSATCDFFNTFHICNGSTNSIGIRAIGTLDRINVYDTDLGALGSDAAMGVGGKNVYARRNNYIFRACNITADCDLINVDSDTWLFRWDCAASTHKVYRKYEFDLKVIDKDNVAINGATAKIWDKDSNLIVDTTTNASGVIATQTISRGYYNQANGNTLQEASPHLIKIEKAGYTTYEADFTLEDKTDWTIALQTSILRNPSMSGGMR